MQLIKQKVVHKAFGEGTIIDQSGENIIVKFSDRESKFIFPDAFIKFIKCTDQTLQAEIELAYEEKVKKAREASERKQLEREQIRIQAEKLKRGTTQPRKSDENNLVFKCNFCNGGCSKSCVGYKGVCSDEQIKYNIEVRKHTWCSNSNSPCRKYYDGSITREELDTQNFDDQFVCYESRMLTAWTAAAGEDLTENNGAARGRRIQDASSNSLAVLTTRYPEAEEEDRIIFGVFVTGEAIEGDEYVSGYVVAKEDYAIELTPNEAKKMKFWNYYQNKDGGNRWGQGLYRYLKDDVCANILADIVKVKSTASGKAHAKKVLEYYCKLKRIKID